MPQGLRLGPRRLGHALPSLLDVVELARRLVEVFFLGTFGRVEAELGAQRLGPGDQLLLHRGVGEAFPLVHLAQVVHARRDDGGGSLEPLDQRRLLVLLDRRRRVDGAAQIARQPIGLAQREIFGGAALLRALDQLLDALQLLAQRPLLGRVLVFVALRDARHGLLVALRDRLVQTLRARHERGPFGGRRGPRLARQRLFAAQALRLARQFREAGVRLLHVELVLMALPRGGNGRLELRPQRADGGIVFRGAERFPFARRLLDLLERVLAANALDLLDHRRTARVQRGAPLVFGPALRFHALRAPRCRCAPCPPPPRSAPRCRRRARTPVRSPAPPTRPRCAPVPAPRRRAAGDIDSTRATRPATRCCHASSASRRAASASSSACIIARALFDTDLFFARAATRSSVSRSSPASLDSTARSSAATPASL